MIGFLRFLGIANAAIWFGGAIAITFFVQPAFFSEEVKTLFPPPYNGAAAEIVIKRYFVLQHWCGVIALLHFLADWLYLGRVLERFTLAVLIIILSLGLAGGLWLQPKMHDLHVTKYRGTTQEQKDTAAKSFRMWHGISQAANVIILPGLLFYLWRVTSSNRTIGFGKSSAGWQ